VYNIKHRQSQRPTARPRQTERDRESESQRQRQRHTYRHTNIHTHKQTHIHTWSYMQTCMHAYMHAYTYIHTCIHDCMHTCMHADRQTDRHTHTSNSLTRKSFIHTFHHLMSLSCLSHSVFTFLLWLIGRSWHVGLSIPLIATAGKGRQWMQEHYETYIDPVGTRSELWIAGGAAALVSTKEICQALGLLYINPYKINRRGML
jgi:hypothetical protein